MFVVLAEIGAALFWLIYPKGDATPSPHVTARKWAAWATLGSIVAHPGTNMFVTSSPLSEYGAVIVLRLIIFPPIAYGIGYVIGRIKSKSQLIMVWNINHQEKCISTTQHRIISKHI